MFLLHYRNINDIILDINNIEGEEEYHVLIWRGFKKFEDVTKAQY